MVEIMEAPVEKNEAMEKLADFVMQLIGERVKAIVEETIEGKMDEIAEVACDSLDMDSICDSVMDNLDFSEIGHRAGEELDISQIAEEVVNELDYDVVCDNVTCHLDVQGKGAGTIVRRGLEELLEKKAE